MLLLILVTLHRQQTLSRRWGRLKIFCRHPSTWEHKLFRIKGRLEDSHGLLNHFGQVCVLVSYLCLLEDGEEGNCCGERLHVRSD